MKLVIAEKPSVAMSLAAVLGATERKDGYLEGSGYLVSWCVGHLLELAQPEAYKEQYAKWRYEDLPILPENWKYEVPKDKKTQLALLCRLMKDKRVDSVVCATDAGREGELIFRLVYEYAGCNKPMERLWISSMEDAAIREGFDRLRPGSDYDKLYDAAVCRAGADWLIGINATRLFSVLYGVTLNVGRVMSPTLALLVQRESDIESFISKPFYVPEITCGGFTASGEKMTERSEAEKIRMDCDHNSAFVRSVEKQVKTIQPPRLYDLTTLQRECKSLYGMLENRQIDKMKLMIIAFSNHLRYLFHDNISTVPLSYELREIEDYYQILSLDSGKIFLLDVDVEESLKEYSVPPLIIQSFLENSFKYNDGKRGMVVFSIKIRTTVENDTPYMCIHMQDNGEGYPKEVLDAINQRVKYSFEEHHVGINNLKHRLSILYGENYSFAFYNLPSGGACSIISIPLDRKEGNL